MRRKREMPAHARQHGRLQHKQRRAGQPRQGVISGKPDDAPRHESLQRRAAVNPKPPILRDLDRRADGLEEKCQQRNRIRVIDGGADLQPPKRVEAGWPGPGRAAKETPAQPILHRVGADHAAQHPAGIPGRQDMQPESIGDHRPAYQHRSRSPGPGFQSLSCHALSPGR